MMYQVEYSWRNLREHIPSWLTLKNATRWIPWLLLFVLVWITLGQFLTFWPQLLTYLTIGVILFFVREELVENRNNLRRVLSIVESREEKGDEEGLSRVLFAIEQQKENIMALGRETQAALTELREAIAVEADQAVQKIIEATNADSATADAIREAVAGVKGIIPDEVEETDIPTTDTPEGEPGDGSVEEPVEEPVEVDPEELPEDDTQV